MVLRPPLENADARQGPFFDALVRRGDDDQNRTDDGIDGDLKSEINEAVNGDAEETGECGQTCRTAKRVARQSEARARTRDQRNDEPGDERRSNQSAARQHLQVIIMRLVWFEPARSIVISGD